MIIQDCMKIEKVLFLGLLLPALPVYAEVYLCNGTWTTKPCSSDSRPAELKRISRSGSASDEIEPEFLEEEPEEIRDQGAATGDPEEGRTRLRTVSELRWKTKRGRSGLELSWAEVSVKNFGEVAAKNVKVELEARGEKRGTVKLSGPETIESHKTAVYQLESSMPIGESARLNVRLDCQNCWR